MPKSLYILLGIISVVFLSIWSNADDSAVRGFFGFWGLIATVILVIKTFGKINEVIDNLNK